jgi:nucleoside-diphosphate-sugar epimerase
VLVRDPAAPRWIAGAPVEWVPGDLGGDAALRRLVDGAGTIFHLAGVLRAGREADFDRGNRGGTANLVRAIAASAPEARLVHVSSLAAAGPSPDPQGVGPECEPAPISWYGRSKLAAERAVSDLGDRRDWSIIRPPAVYGPRDTDIFEFFRMAARGVVAVPSGERWLTLAWVGDVVRSAIAAAASPCQRSVFHVGDLEPLRLEDLVSMLSEAGGLRARTVRLPAALITGAGLLGSTLQRLGWRRVALTADKGRELLARHWTSHTASSLEALGVDELMPFNLGAASTWSWYRARGWVR